MEKTTKNQLSNLRRGGTIIENLVAAVVMGIALMGMVSMYGFVTTTTKNNDRIAMAYNIGRQVMEETKVQGFAHAPEGSSSSYFTDDGNPIPEADLATVSPTFVVQRQLVTVDPIYQTHVQSGAQTLVAGRREVTVTVAFADAPGEPDFVIKTFLTESGS